MNEAEYKHQHHFSRAAGSARMPCIPPGMTLMPALPQFYLPDPLAQWPWKRELNPHYEQVKPTSEAWLHSFQLLDAKSQKSFDRCNFGKYLILMLSCYG